MMDESCCVVVSSGYLRVMADGWVGLGRGGGRNVLMIFMNKAFI